MSTALLASLDCMSKTLDDLKAAVNDRREMARYAELLGLVRELASARSKHKNGLYRDTERDLATVLATVDELVSLYEADFYDGE